MKVSSVKTHLISLGESIEAILEKYITNLPENSIVVITSKIISITQGRVIPKRDYDKKELIEQEAEAILLSENNKYNICLTIKNNILLPSAGIDESNIKDAYILYPQNIYETAQEIWKYLRNKLSVNNLGVVITDSHTTPMRRGVTGIALGWCGFEPLHSYIGQPDLYNQELRVTQINLLDAIATAAVFIMGEGNESTPIAILENAPKIQFLNRPPSKEEIASITINLEDDLYYPILKNANWKK